MNTVERLEKIVESPRLRSSSKSFVESMLEQAKKRDLSEKQVSYIDKFWEECFPPEEILAEEKAWIDTFTDEMRENVRIMGEYYEKHYPTSRLAKNYKTEGWLPNKEVFEKSVDSQWAQRVLGNYKQVHRFQVGDMCVLRDTSKNRSQYTGLVGSPLLILECIKNVNREFSNHYVVIEVAKMDEQRQYTLSEASVNAIKSKKGK